MAKITAGDTTKVITNLRKLAGEARDVKIRTVKGNGTEEYYEIHIRVSDSDYFSRFIERRGFPIDEAVEQRVGNKFWHHLSGRKNIVVVIR